MSGKIYSIEEIKRIVAPIALKYEVDRVFLFGSYARGKANGASDLDFVIDKGRLRGLKLAGMLGDLQDNFDKKVDLITSSSFSYNENNFKQNIEKEMIVVYEQ